uniref:PMP-22/EMP/MP20/Claudin tight junction n=1 Tax=Mesocestoides corti TaxID=53468 RepID=A0A5K3FRX3_MESCO
MASFDINVSDAENRCLFITFLAFSLLAACLNFIAFVSPYWIEARSGAYALFNRIGLWTACFDGYMRPNQYDKAYYGCFYIYYVEYDSIREWLNPIWLYVVQVIASIGILCHGLVLFFLVCQATGRVAIESLHLTKWLMSGHFIAGISLLGTLLGFTYGSYDSRWVPYPRFNKLSWAFAVAIISLIFTIASFFTMLVFYLKVNAKIIKARLIEQQNMVDNDDEVQDDDDRNIDDEIQKIASTSASRIYSQPGGYQKMSVPSGDARIGFEVIEDLGDSGNEDPIAYARS